MSWLNKLLPSRMKKGDGNNRSVPEGLWTKCERCQAVLYRPELERNLHVCPKCAYHFRVGARERLRDFLDKDPEPEEIGAGLTPVDHLKFKDRKRYRDRLQQASRSTGESDALIAVAGCLHGAPVTACAFEFRFLGGSMGAVVGERFVRAVERAQRQYTPLVCFCASGGARMQEGLASLLQMAKSSAALVELRRAGLPYVSVLTDPTTGGVSASIGALGDVVIAEPGALIGFAGPRVIEQTTRETLPEGFQRSESLLKHGGLDIVMDRREQRDRVAALLSMLGHGRSPPVVETEGAPEAERA